MSQFLTAREAASELGVSLDTLYAYVSRGLLRSETGDLQKRSRRYPREDVERLKEHKADYRHPDRVAAGTMHAGMPVMESAITMLTSDRFYYRGYDALALATTHSVEQVAALIWTGEFEAPQLQLWRTPPASILSRYYWLGSQLGGLMSSLDALQVCLPLAALDDIAAYDLRPEAVAQTGARILQLLATVAAGTEWANNGIARTIQRGWVPADERAISLLTAALILCADQELNVTSFTARCVASAGGAPYAVVSAGLSALQGVKHAGQTERIEAFLRETESPDAVRSSITSVLKRGEPVPGFGEVVPGFGPVFYPGGDPRGKLLLALTTERYPRAAPVLLAQRVVEETYALLGEHPTIFFGLVVLARTLELPPNAAITLFAIGRTMGWIGHAIEQYQANQVIRPRARYIGRPPQPAS
ncbi:MAG: citrate/2-methylcitrate synthase [Ktedonobacterales bacterium]